MIRCALILVCVVISWNSCKGQEVDAIMLEYLRSIDEVDSYSDTSYFFKEVIIENHAWVFGIRASHSQKFLYIRKEGNSLILGAKKIDPSFMVLSEFLSKEDFEFEDKLKCYEILLSIFEKELSEPWIIRD